MLMQEENQNNATGQVITPNVVTPSAPQPQPSTTPVTAAQVSYQPVPVQEAVAATSVQIPEPTPFQMSQEATGFTPAPQNVLESTDQGIAWTASEYIANAKNAGWFIILAMGTIVLDLAIYFITNSIMSTVVVAICGLMVGIFAARQPQVLKYRIDNHGLQIGEKFYAYRGFKSFSVVTEHAMAYISLLPLRRFMPPLTVHFSPEDQDRILGTLADYLPYEEHKGDMIDSLMRRARF